ncbi:MAG: hypothetical protein WA919_00925 [Coleofasciculaceae cyanobacterium]
METTNLISVSSQFGVRKEFTDWPELVSTLSCASGLSNTSGSGEGAMGVGRKA